MCISKKNYMQQHILKIKEHRIKLCIRNSFFSLIQVTHYTQTFIFKVCSLKNVSGLFYTVQKPTEIQRNDSFSTNQLLNKIDSNIFDRVGPTNYFLS